VGSGDGFRSIRMPSFSMTRIHASSSKGLNPYALGLENGKAGQPQPATAGGLCSR
jgi:hypothetical protein